AVLREDGSHVFGEAHAAAGHLPPRLPTYGDSFRLDRPPQLDERRVRFLHASVFGDFFELVFGLGENLLGLIRLLFGDETLHLVDFLFDLRDFLAMLGGNDSPNPATNNADKISVEIFSGIGSSSEKSTERGCVRNSSRRL